MICRVCEIDKGDEDFYLKKGRNCRNTRCKSCDALYLKEVRNKNKESFTAWTRAYTAKNKDKINARRRELFALGIASQEKRKRWVVANREKINLRRREKRAKTKERNKEIQRERWLNDTNYKMKSLLRSRLKSAVKNGYKGSSAITALGCTLADFQSYIESKFQAGMTWDNWSQFGWHLDHIKPLSSFDLTDDEQVLIAGHYTNFQPLWWKDNLSKGSKIMEKDNEC